MFHRRDQPSAEERKAERIKLVGAELAEALPGDGDPWWTKSHLVKLNALLSICCISAATLGYDGAINAMMPVGKVIGSFVAAPMSNVYGRKKALVFGLGLAIAGAAVQAGSVNYGLLLFSRLLIGLGAAFMSQASPLLLAELAYPTQRGKITSLYNTFFFFGAISAAWISFGTLKMNGDWSWRIPTLLQGAAPIGQLIFSWFLPESPRFLVAKGKIEEARSLLIKYHAGGDANSTLVGLEVLQIQEALHAEQNAEKLSIGRIMASPANRRRLLIVTVLGIATQWAGNSVISYYLTLVLNTIGITDPTQQSLINGGLQIFNLISCIGCGVMLVDRLGRRALFLWSAAGMTISYVIWTILNSRFAATQSVGIGYAVIPMLFIFYFHYAIAITPLTYAYPTEIFPYELRGWGVAITLIIANTTLILAQFVNPIAMGNLGWKYYIVFCILDALFFVMVWLYFPETKGKSLEEVAAIFEPGYSRDSGDLEKISPTPEASHVEIDRKL
ncbi:general substrate transporter [Thozetella sp. PMI_491]|nr:general substrate transporter [Thozetella sp. PMI_491]